MEKHYALVKGKKVKFGPAAINVLYGLEQIAVWHPIFKEPLDCDKQDTLEKVAWLRTKWDITPTEKYQLLLHNLNTVTCVVGIH